jgi:hypothetical protein
MVGVAQLKLPTLLFQPAFDAKIQSESGNEAQQVSKTLS